MTAPAEQMSAERVRLAPAALARLPRKGSEVRPGGQRSAGGHTNRCSVFDLDAGDQIARYRG